MQFCLLCLVFSYFRFVAVLSHQTNAVIISRAKSNAAHKRADGSDSDEYEAENLQEALKRSQLEEAKFVNFWTGIQTGIEAFARKPHHEKKKVVFQRTAKKLSVS